MANDEIKQILQQAISINQNIKETNRLLQQLLKFYPIPEEVVLRQLVPPDEMQAIWMVDGMEGRIWVFSVELYTAIAAGQVAKIEFRIPEPWCSVHRTSCVITTNYTSPDLTLDYIVLDPGGTERTVVPYGRRLTINPTRVTFGPFAVKFIGSDWQFTNNTTIDVEIRMEFETVVWLEKELAEEYLDLLKIMRERLRKWRRTYAPRTEI